MTANVRNNRGFTLIELIVTMGVAALLLTIGVPNFIELVRNHRMAAQY
ncbi:MAG: pilus assembly FimT family protein, partial [Methylococcales bacterium]